MKYRKLGRTDLDVSELGFGAWAIGGALKLGGRGLSYGRTDDQESLRALAAAIDGGVNFFDTADIYGVGLSERLVGQAIKGKREKMIVATKVGNVVGENGVRIDLSYNHIMSACKESLLRLNTDYIDIYQLHSPPESVEDECFGALKELKKEGVIRFAGVSVAHQFDKAKKFIESGIVDTILLYYNMLFRGAEEIVFPLAEKYNIGIIAASPLSRGLLAGGFDSKTRFESVDIRSIWNEGEKDRNWFLEQLEAIENIKEKLVVGDGELRGLAFGFSLGSPVVSAIIPGMKTEEQALSNLAAYDTIGSLKEKLSL